MARYSFLRLTRLEDRTTPATFGSPWGDARHLTLSFVPDGTTVDGVGSNLFQLLGPQGAAWQTEILRAVETWAQNANVNVGVVADGGQDLGTPGPIQGDGRFGDIRISARPLSDNVLAITTPSGVVGGTRIGDIVLNSTKAFSIGGGSGYDLYSVLLQEAGHALGIDNSTDPASPMYETYSGVRTGLTAGDVANIQSLYGARAADTLEWWAGNDTPATARELTRPRGAPANASVVANADVTSASDADYYLIRTNLDNPYGLTVRLNTAGSLLAPKLTVYGPDGTSQLARAQSVDPQTGEVSVSLSAVLPWSYYYVKVEDATPTFGAGAYQVKLVFDPNAPDVVANGTATRFDYAHTNDTLDGSQRLYTAAGYAANTHYSALAMLRDAADVDTYRVRAPWVGANQQAVLTVNARAVAPTALSPVVTLYDKNLAAVPAQILVNADGSYTVQLANATPGADYFVKVRDAAAGTGDYQLDVDFRAQVVNLQTLSGGTMASASSPTWGSLQAASSQVMHFVLSATGADPTVQAGVRMGVFDAAGHLVMSLFAHAGQTVTATTYLGAGTYTIRFDALTRTGAAAPSLTYNLQATTLTDAISPVPSDPNAPQSSYTWTKFQDDYYALLVLDALGDVIW